MPPRDTWGGGVLGILNPPKESAFNELNPLTPMGSPPPWISIQVGDCSCLMTAHQSRIEMAVNYDVCVAEERCEQLMRPHRLPLSSDLDLPPAQALPPTPCYPCHHPALLL